jgi:hypothetical protein
MSEHRIDTSNLRLVMDGKVLYDPMPQQRKFHLSPAKFRLFGGSAGGGKTIGIIGEALLRSMKGDIPLTGAIFRRSFPELEATIIRTMLNLLPTWFYKYNQQQHLMTLKNGSMIEFCYAESDNDVIRYQSREWDWLAIDELTHFSQFQWSYLLSRLRTSKPGVNTKFFAATNPGGRGHCVPFGDVLTKEGWVPIKDVKVGDKVMTLLEDNSVGYVKVDQKMEEDYEGKLYVSDSPNAEFTCTPNHKIVRVTETKNKSGRVFHEPTLIEVKDLKGVTRLPKIGEWKGESPEFFELKDVNHRKLKHPQPLKLKFADYCEFMGWFLSEGSTMDGDCRIMISQSKPDERKAIRDLLNRCSFHYKETGVDFVFYSPAWKYYLSQFGNSREKFVPQEIKNSSRELLRIFFDAIMLGDGDKAGRYYTLSDRLASDMEEVGLKLGYRTRRTSRLRKNRKYVSHQVQFKKNRLGWLEKKNIRTEDFSGKVYCIGINNLHRFYLRQNGTVYLSGNSWVKERWVVKNCQDEHYKPSDYDFVPAGVLENPYIMQSNPDYIENLKMLPEKERKALLEGNWDIFEGVFFPEWSPGKHIVDDFDVPEDWQLIMGWDDGTREARAVYLCAIDPDQKVWCIWEYYKAGENLAQAAEIIRSKLKDAGYWGRIYKCVVDPSMKREDSQTGINSVEVLEGMGFGFKVGAVELGNNDRVEGWRIMKSYMMHKPYEEPMLKFFRSCSNIIRTLPQLIYYQPKSSASSKKEDLDTTQEDHGPDAVRYLLMSLDRLPSRFENNTFLQVKRRKYSPVSRY